MAICIFLQRTTCTSIFKPLLLLGAVLLCLLGCERGPREGLLAGDKAPELQLVDLEGRSVRLHDYSSKLTVLNFWASWCTPCLIEMPDLKRLYGHFKDKGMNVVAVAVEDDQESIQRLVKEMELPFTVLIDKSGRAKALYRIAGFPETFFLDNKGVIQIVDDPADGSQVTRIMGPRQWSADHVIRQVDRMLSEAVDNR